MTDNLIGKSTLFTCLNFPDHYTYDYTPFGSVYANNTVEAVKQRYQYTGREQNPVSDTMYYRYRTYATTAGRFVSRDPSGYPNNIDGNLYVYCYNRATSWYDPEGKAGRMGTGGKAPKIIKGSGWFLLTACIGTCGNNLHNSLDKAEKTHEAHLNKCSNIEDKKERECCIANANKIFNLDAAIAATEYSACSLGCMVPFSFF